MIVFLLLGTEVSKLPVEADFKAGVEGEAFKKVETGESAFVSCNEKYYVGSKKQFARKAGSVCLLPW